MFWDLILIYDDFLLYNFFAKLLQILFFLFSEEQIKQRKLFEKAEKQREMEITRQLVRYELNYIYIYIYILFEQRFKIWDLKLN